MPFRSRASISGGSLPSQLAVLAVAGLVGGLSGAAQASPGGTVVGCLRPPSTFSAAQVRSGAGAPLLLAQARPGFDAAWASPGLPAASTQPSERPPQPAQPAPPEAQPAFDAAWVNPTFPGTAAQPTGRPPQPVQPAIPESRQAFQPGWGTASLPGTVGRPTESRSQLAQAGTPDSLPPCTYDPPLPPPGPVIRGMW